MGVSYDISLSGWILQQSQRLANARGENPFSGYRRRGFWRARTLWPAITLSPATTLTPALTFPPGEKLLSGGYIVDPPGSTDGLQAGQLAKVTTPPPAAGKIC